MGWLIETYLEESEEFSRKLKKKDILKILKDFKYDRSQYCLVYKAALVLQDVIDECNDIDVEISPKLEKELLKDGYIITTAPLGGHKLEITDRLECFTQTGFKKDAVNVNGINCTSIEACLKEYKRRNRPKDQATIKAIEEYLQSTNNII